jgi:hypothetical protein
MGVPLQEHRGGEKGLDRESTLFKVKPTRGASAGRMASSDDDDRRVGDDVEAPGDVEGHMEDVAVI